MIKVAFAGGLSLLASLVFAQASVTPYAPLPGAAPSLLPAGVSRCLVWHDEFDGDAVDTAKWSFRTNFWGRRAEWFAALDDGAVTVSNGCARLGIVRLADGSFRSAQLQTGGLLWDDLAPKSGNGVVWPFLKRETPKFMHRYGYYECRAKFQSMPGWWTAFWLQSPCNGATLDPRRSGVECDVMESFEPGRHIVHAFHYNGCGPEYRRFNAQRAPYTPTPEGAWKVSYPLATNEFHTVGLKWEPDGYTVYVDGRQSGEKVGLRGDETVSEAEQFILVSTELMGFRKDGRPDPRVEAAWAAGDAFEVDYVRVWELEEHARVAERPVPRPALLRRLADESLETYALMHWGPNTVMDQAWGYGDEDPKAFNPTRYDPDRIVSAVKAAGLGAIILVAKHHDGFCLWPTRTTEHSIAASPYRGGKGDLVKELAEACARGGLKFGVYISPWDRHDAKYATDDYVLRYHEQIRELLGGAYGPIFEMWFDGANGGDGYYGGAREKRRISADYYRFGDIFRMVRALQPDVCIFNERDDADLRWPGNEEGLLEPDCRATVPHFDPENYAAYYGWAACGAVTGVSFHPPECDFPLRRGWFYHKAADGRSKSGEYLMKSYLRTVGNGGTMNLGIAPTAAGELTDEDVAALRRFGELRRMFFSREAKEGEPFNLVVLREDISRGELVDGWELTADGRPVLAGKAVGVKRIRPLLTPVTAKEVQFRITKAAGATSVEVRRYFVDPELLRTVLKSVCRDGETDTAKWMKGFLLENELKTK